MWAKLRKFGLQYCDLPTMMWNVTFLLRGLILDVDIRHKKGIPIILYILAAVTSISFLYVYAFSMLWFVFVRCPKTGDLIAGSVVLSIGFSSEIGIAKLFFMAIHIKNVRHLVERYLACDALVEPGSRFSKNILKTMREVKKRAIFLWAVIMFNCVLYITVPLFVPGRHLTEDLFVIYGLEPMFETPNYHIAYLLSALGVCGICYPPATITAFLIVITGYTEAQMRALSIELIHLWEDAEESYKNQNLLKNYVQGSSLAVFQDEREKIIFSNKYVNTRLKDIIKSHATNIYLLSQIENVFRGAVVLELGLLVVTLITELLGGLENTFLQIPFAVIQVAMDCLTGQRLMDASEIFERAVYDCKWENFDKNNRRVVLLILQNSQRTMTLSAGGIVMLSFTCLMSVMKLIYSAYTTLRTTMH